MVLLVYVLLRRKFPVYVIFCVPTVFAPLGSRLPEEHNVGHDFHTSYNDGRALLFTWHESQLPLSNTWVVLSLASHLSRDFLNMNIAVVLSISFRS